MPTPVSSSTSYCSGAQFTDFNDWRSAAELLSDAGVRLATESEVQSSARLNRLLLRASGWVESACLVGSKYTPADLQAVDGASAEFLAGLVADLTMAFLWRRRPHLDKAVPPQFVEAEAILQRIRNGERIFALQETMNAGLPGIEDWTLQDLEDEARTTFLARNYFGVRAISRRLDC